MPKESGRERERKRKSTNAFRNCAYFVHFSNYLNSSSDFKQRRQKPLFVNLFTFWSFSLRQPPKTSNVHRSTSLNHVTSCSFFFVAHSNDEEKWNEQKISNIRYMISWLVPLFQLGLFVCAFHAILYMVCGVLCEFLNLKMLTTEDICCCCCCQNPCAADCEEIY